MIALEEAPQGRSTAAPRPTPSDRVATRRNSPASFGLYTRPCTSVHGEPRACQRSSPITAPATRAAARRIGKRAGDPALFGAPLLFRRVGRTSGQRNAWTPSTGPV
eukprot:tig00000741_g3846.t1